MARWAFLSLVRFFKPFPNSQYDEHTGSFPFLTNYPELSLDYWAQNFGSLYSLWLGNQLFVIISEPHIVKDLMVTNGAFFSSKAASSGVGGSVAEATKVSVEAAHEGYVAAATDDWEGELMKETRPYSVFKLSGKKCSSSLKSYSPVVGLQRHHIMTAGMPPTISVNSFLIRKEGENIVASQQYG